MEVPWERAHGDQSPTFGEKAQHRPAHSRLRRNLPWHHVKFEKLPSNIPAGNQFLTQPVWASDLGRLRVLLGREADVTGRSGVTWGKIDR